MKLNGSNNRSFYQGDFKTGINFYNWILRNNSSFSSGDGKTYYRFNETTLSRTIERIKAILQLGQITSNSELLDSADVNGFQLYSDSSYQNSKLTVPITGMSEKPATVEVTQNNRLLYRTIIPAGPFQLNNISGVSSSQPLHVKVIQDDGTIQEFDVITSNKDLKNPQSSTSFNFFMGKYRKNSSDERIHTPFITGFEGGINYLNHNFLGGMEISSKYKSIVGSVNSVFGEHRPLSTGFGIKYASSSNKGDGFQANANLSLPVSVFSLGLSTIYRSRNYSTLYESLQIDNIEDPLDDNLANNQTKTSSSLSLSLGNQRYGSLSYSLSYSQYYGDKKDNYSNTISYGKRFPFMSFNISYQKSSNFEDRTFVNINVPINNSSSFSTQYQHYKTSSLTTNYSNYHNDLFRYSIGATADKDSKDKNISGNINATTAYSQISATGSFSKGNQKSAMLTASGAIAYSDGLFATSPVELGDTFGILRVPGQSGILVNSMGGGTTITNHFGTAVIPNLPVNKKTTVLLNTKNLPLNVMLGTTSFDIALAKGTVFSREIPVNTMKQVLLEIKKPDGKPVNTANSVIDDKGNLIGVIMGDGNVIISNEQIGKPLKVKSDNGDICSVDYSVPEEFNPDFLYEKVDAICK